MAKSLHDCKSIYYAILAFAMIEKMASVQMVQIARSTQDCIDGTECPKKILKATRLLNYLYAPCIL